MALIIEIKVIPRSGRSLLMIDKSGILKCFVKAEPKKGKANKEVILIIAKALGVSKNVIDIVSGATSRKKLLKIEVANLTYDIFCQRLGIFVQKTLF